MSIKGSKTSEMAQPAPTERPLVPKQIFRLACPRCGASVILFYSTRKHSFYLTNSENYTDFHRCFKNNQ